MGMEQYWKDLEFPRVLREAQRRGYTIVVQPADGEGGGKFVARLFCMADYRLDCEATADTATQAARKALEKAESRLAGRT